MKNIRIASRASKLALIQSNIVKTALEGLSADVNVSIVKISTEGDRDKSSFLYKKDSVGFFTSEVENALLDRRADIAVHSLKDLPTSITTGLQITAIPKRESPADALVSSLPVSSIADLPAGSTIGTSSLRRIAQIRHLRNDLKCVPLRGNVETRLSKVESGIMDSAIVACAGVNRLGLSEKISAVLEPNKFLIAPGQGALAIQTRTDDTQLIELVLKLDDENTRIGAEAERQILAKMHGGCSIPLGVFSEILGDTITLDAVICDTQGTKYIRTSRSAPLDQAKNTANEIAKELLNAGGKEILEQIRIADQ
ncbi:hydroxymethylbilane synthase [Planctomycetota bacterium]